MSICWLVPNLSCVWQEDRSIFSACTPTLIDFYWPGTCSYDNKKKVLELQSTVVLSQRNCSAASSYFCESQNYFIMNWSDSSTLSLAEKNAAKQERNLRVENNQRVNTPWWSILQLFNQLYNILYRDSSAFSSMVH